LTSAVHIYKTGTPEHTNTFCCCVVVRWYYLACDVTGLHGHVDTWLLYKLYSLLLLITGSKSQSIALNEQKIHSGHLPGLLGRL